MSELLWLIPFFPLAGFIFLSLAGKSTGRNTAAITGILTTGLSTLMVIITGINFISSLPEESAFRQTLWSWIDMPGLQVNIAFYMDSPGFVFAFIVTFVSFLIHIYSAAFMRDEEGVSRFFAWMNLFTASMLILVMSENLLLLYLGWEGVGLCSYLLIGFWYKDPSNGYAARKAFIVTRIGDTAMAIGLFFLFRSFGTFNIRDILNTAPGMWSTGSTEAIIAAVLLLIAALGKSAQLPLQTWLPDAMAGPSPVSALIHAATMVTAGVYLIVRLHGIFDLAPVIKTITAVIGAATLLMAALSALVQRDIKRVLAWSTISQIGYMFMALGVGAWSAAVFHFFTHAFFKALLFLAAGAVIIKLHHEHDMFKMGGLRKEMPLVFYTFLAGAASLAAIPLVTAGFYSKEMILADTFSHERGGIWLWIVGLSAAGLTALYTFRMVIVTFFGKMKMKPEKGLSSYIKIPLVVLGILAILAGFIESPFTESFSAFLHHSLPEFDSHAQKWVHIILQIASAIIVIAGVFLAWLFYMKIPSKIYSLKKQPAVSKITSFLLSGWGFDYLYRVILENPYIWISRFNRKDFIDKIYTGIARMVSYLHEYFILSQNGNIRWYLSFIVAGLIIGITIIVFI